MIVNRENCLYYGLPGIVILAVSLMMSTLISTDFGGDTFVKAISFLGCNGLLWLLYLMLFQYLPIGLLEVWQSRKHPVTIRVLETENKTDKPLPEPVTGHIVQPTVSVHPLSEEQ